MTRVIRPQRIASEVTRVGATQAKYIALFIALIFSLLMLTSCVSQPNPNSGDRGDNVTNSAEKSGDGKLRSDLKPLVDRFPMLAAADSATWLSGTMGSADAPGPSTYWIDAVIVLPSNEYAALKEVATDTGAQLPSGFSEALKSSVPSGGKLRSAELTDLFSQDGFTSQVVLIDDGKTLVLSTMFE